MSSATQLYPSPDEMEESADSVLLPDSTLSGSRSTRKKTQSAQTMIPPAPAAPTRPLPTTPPLEGSASIETMSATASTPTSFPPPPAYPNRAQPASMEWIPSGDIEIFLAKIRAYHALEAFRVEFGLMAAQQAAYARNALIARERGLVRAPNPDPVTPPAELSHPPLPSEVVIHAKTSVTADHVPRPHLTRQAHTSDDTALDFDLALSQSVAGHAGSVRATPVRMSTSDAKQLPLAPSTHRNAPLLRSRTSETMLSGSTLAVPPHLPPTALDAHAHVSRSSQYSATGSVVTLDSMNSISATSTVRNDAVAVSRHQQTMHSMNQLVNLTRPMLATHMALSPRLHYGIRSMATIPRLRRARSLTSLTRPRVEEPRYAADDILAAAGSTHSLPYKGKLTRRDIEEALAMYPQLRRHGSCDGCSDSHHHHHHHHHRGFASMISNFMHRIAHPHHHHHDHHDGHSQKSGHSKDGDHKGSHGHHWHWPHFHKSHHHKDGHDKDHHHSDSHGKDHHHKDCHKDCHHKDHHKDDHHKDHHHGHGHGHHWHWPHFHKSHHSKDSHDKHGDHKDDHHGHHGHHWHWPHFHRSHHKDHDKDDHHHKGHHGKDHHHKGHHDEDHHHKGHGSKADHHHKIHHHHEDDHHHKDHHHKDHHHEDHYHKDHHHKDGARHTKDDHQHRRHPDEVAHHDDHHHRDGHKTHHHGDDHHPHAGADKSTHRHHPDSIHSTSSRHSHGHHWHWPHFHKSDHHHHKDDHHSHKSEKEGHHWHMPHLFHRHHHDSDHDHHDLHSHSKHKAHDHGRHEHDHPPRSGRSDAYEIGGVPEFGPRRRDTIKH